MSLHTWYKVMEPPIILHEYLRNIEPHDPHIKFKINDPKKRILKLI